MKKPINRDGDTLELKKTIRNESHNQKNRSKDTEQFGMLPNSTKSTTIAVSPTRRCEK